MSLRVQRLFIYPVKSLLPVEVAVAELTDTGFQFDRSFALVDAHPATITSDQDLPLVRHLTVKRVFALTQFQPVIDTTWTNLTVRYLGCDERPCVSVPLTPSPLSSINARRFRLSIFGTTAIGIDVGEEAAAFFREHLNIDARLVFIGGTGRREVPGARFAADWLANVPQGISGQGRPQQIKFADASPLLVTSTASELETKRRLPLDHQEQDAILQFRPNIHIDVSDILPAWDEDHWLTLKIGDNGTGGHVATIRCVYACVRCLSINANMETGQMSPRDQQLYGLLARDRRVNDEFPHKPVFGQYAFGFPFGSRIRVGDRVTIAERK